MSALIGQEYGAEEKSLPISVSDIRKWAMAVYYPEPPPPLFWDEEFAATTRYGGIVAPEDFNPFAWITADGPRKPHDFSGPIRHSGPEPAFGVAPPETSFSLNGGSSVVYGVRMRPGDVITAGKTKVVDYKERDGRLGRTLYTYSDLTWTNQDGEIVRTYRRISIRY